MKTRTSLVSNSSTSSFIVAGKNLEKWKVLGFSFNTSESGLLSSLSDVESFCENKHLNEYVEEFYKLIKQGYSISVTKVSSDDYDDSLSVLIYLQGFQKVMNVLNDKYTKDFDLILIEDVNL